MEGHQNNYLFVVPEWNLVVVRLGADGAIINDRYDEFFAALRRALPL